MKRGTTGQDLFMTVEHFMNLNEVEWEKRAGVCADGGSKLASVQCNLDKLHDPQGGISCRTPQCGVA